MTEEGLCHAHCWSLNICWKTTAFEMPSLPCANCQRHAPAKDRQPNLASLAGRCSLAPMTFTIKETFKVPQALTAQVTTPGKGCRDSCWKRPQAHYYIRRKLVSCQFLVKPLPSLGCFTTMCQMFREVSPSKQESSFWFTNDRQKTTLESASAPGCGGWFA